MYTHQTQLRVRYAETDQMGVVYYGNYAQYFEVGRVESIRALGITYKTIETEGVLLPVVDIHVRYLRSAKYDDLLTIESTIKEMPSKSQIVFHQQIFNDTKQLICTAKVILVFVDNVHFKKSEAPKKLLTLLQPFFKN
jgi:acyl-CoA thioester hydrolase